MPDPDFFDWESIADEVNNNPYEYTNFIPVDATDARGFGISPDINQSLQLTKGSYRLKIGNPTGTITGFRDKIQDFVVVDSMEKGFKVFKLKYSIMEDKLFVSITIKDNPIPVLVIWGAVAIAVMITGAITMGSVLEDITPIATPIVETISQLPKIVNSPLGYGIILIFLLPLLLPLFKKK